MNPWVLFANGEVEYKKSLKNTDGRAARLGDDVNVDGMDGIVIGEKNLGGRGPLKGSTYVERYRNPKTKPESKEKL